MQRKLPALRALAAQLLAVALVALACHFGAAWFQFHPTLLTAAAAQAFLAAALGQLFGLSPWWLPINLTFLPALLLLTLLPIPRWILLATFLLLLLLHWNSFTGGVPLYLTGDDTRKKLGEILKSRGPTFTFIDLGSGLGGTLCQLSRQYLQAQFHGVETAPLVFLISWLRCLPRKNCHIRYRSLWKENLGEYDVVYSFLSPLPMPDLWQKARAEMKNNSLLISNTFDIPGVPPWRVIELRDWRRTKLLIWEL